MLIGQNSRNRAINGRFDFWQRNTTFATPGNGAYTADRWRVNYDGTIGTFSVSRQAFTVGQTDVPGEPSYFARWDHTVAGSGSTDRILQQPIEGVKTFAGKKTTLSFYAKADAARTMGLQLTQFFGTGGSPSASVSVAVQNVDLTTVWQRFTVTFDLPSIAGKTLGTNGNDYLLCAFRMPLNVVFSADIAAVMAVEGEAQADFALAGESLAQELSLCQRFFELIGFVGGTPVAIGAMGAGSGTTYSKYQIRKRAVPVITSTGTFTDEDGVGNGTATFIAYAAGLDCANLVFSSGRAQGRPQHVRADTNSSGLFVDAEF